MQGRVHSIETFGTVDGPGTRLVVFMQGCPMRCAYCHNPDTWDVTGGEALSVSQVLERFERNRPYYRAGGITVSGGEPLVQTEFVTELFRAAHEAPHGRIHTCLDTSGATFERNRCSALLDHTDLALLDIKHANPEAYDWLCEWPATDAWALADELARRKIPMVVRHVVVPGITDDSEELASLGKLMAQWPNVVGLELLAYHTMGRRKYDDLGIAYRLDDTPVLDKARLPELRRIVLGR
ncbi:MAG: pyruvate formate-lyase-activating protein [Coriobacteriales bacterium]|nr:pyruvate formate-lyase-activating protein [Coriobacteriales bacterium]